LFPPQIDESILALQNMDMLHERGANCVCVLQKPSRGFLQKVGLSLYSCHMATLKRPGRYLMLVCMTRELCRPLKAFVDIHCFANLSTFPPITRTFPS
jgi:hypothetical protein